MSSRRPAFSVFLVEDLTEAKTFMASGLEPVVVPSGNGFYLFCRQGPVSTWINQETDWKAFASDEGGFDLYTYANLSQEQLVAQLVRSKTEEGGGA